MKMQELMQEALKLAGLEKIPGDSCIMYDNEKDVKKICVGVDMHTPEILVAKQIGCDAVLSHHPAGGSAVGSFSEVLPYQVEKMVECGVPINKAEKAIGTLQKEMDAMHPISMNTGRNDSAAKLLDMNYMNIHQPADLIGERAVQAHLDADLPENPTLQDIIDSLMKIHEYEAATTKPTAIVGTPQSHAGKVVVLMAGGTDGGPSVQKAFFEAGVGTLVLMHFKPQNIEEITKHAVGNIVVAGHMSSDSIGINAITKKWKELGVEVVMA